MILISPVPHTAPENGYVSTKDEIGRTIFATT